MPTIQLFIPDRALRGALIEQLRPQTLGTVTEGTDFAAALKSDDTLAIILDETAADKKILKILTDEASEKRNAFSFWARSPKNGIPVS